MLSIPRYILAEDADVAGGSGCCALGPDRGWRGELALNNVASGAESGDWY